MGAQERVQVGNTAMPIHGTARDLAVDPYARYPRQLAESERLQSCVGLKMETRLEGRPVRGATGLPNDDPCELLKGDMRTLVVSLRRLLDDPSSFDVLHHDDGVAATTMAKELGTSFRGLSLLAQRAGERFDAAASRGESSFRAPVPEHAKPWSVPVTTPSRRTPCGVPRFSFLALRRNFHVTPIDTFSCRETHEVSICPVPEIDNPALRDASPGTRLAEYARRNRAT